jgi:regulator of protease activity HflC (stomatin/prohibitin superfamily)
MIQQILSFLLEFWRQLVPWAIRDKSVGQIGFIVKLGRPGRNLKPGWNWKIPILEEAVTEDGRAYAYILDPQSLQTGDGKAVVLRLSVTCRITNVRRYVGSVYDGRSNVQDVAAGELGDIVAASDAGEVLSGEILPEVLKRVRRVAKKWGMAVDSVKFVDAAQTRSLRLWQSTFASAGQD